MFGYNWHFERLLYYREAFFHGLVNTIALSAALIALSTLLGVSVGIGLRRTRWWTRPALVVIDILKGLPPLVIVYAGFVILSVQFVGFSVPAFAAFVISLGLNVSAFVADLTRAGITNVPPEYLEAGRAMGLTERQLDRYVTVPFAARELIPPFSYLFVETIKLTSLAQIFTINETVNAATNVITDMGQSLEVWILVGLIYLALVLPAMFVARRLERRFKRESGIGDFAPTVRDPLDPRLPRRARF